MDVPWWETSLAHKGSPMLPEPRYHAIECILRQRISSRQYAVGSRIPTRRELSEEFSASAFTLQRALDRLVERGFLVAKGARGTFVCDRLPQQSTYAIVFADAPGGETWNRY
jgi:GntR family transcriptional regulator